MSPMRFVSTVILEKLVIMTYFVTDAQVIYITFLATNNMDALCITVVSVLKVRRNIQTEIKKSRHTVSKIFNKKVLSIL